MQATRKKGDKLVLEFKTEFDTVEEPVNCVTTHRIERITSDGHLVYEEICQYRTKQVARDKPDPVTLDAKEAEKLAPGELVSVYVDDARNGAVIEVMKGKSIVQVRADRVKPPSETAKKN